MFDLFDILTVVVLFFAGVHFLILPSLASFKNSSNLERIFNSVKSHAAQYRSQSFHIDGRKIWGDIKTLTNEIGEKCPPIKLRRAGLTITLGLSDEVESDHFLLQHFNIPRETQETGATLTKVLQLAFNIGQFSVHKKGYGDLADDYDKYKMTELNTYLAEQLTFDISQEDYQKIYDRLELILRTVRNYEKKS